MRVTLLGARITMDYNETEREFESFRVQLENAAAGRKIVYLNREFPLLPMSYERSNAWNANWMEAKVKEDVDSDSCLGGRWNFFFLKIYLGTFQDYRPGTLLRYNTALLSITRNNRSRKITTNIPSRTLWRFWWPEKFCFLRGQFLFQALLIKLIFKSLDWNAGGTKLNII